MNQRTIRAVMVGAGRVAEHYASLLSTAPLAGFEIAAVCDPVPERAASVGGRLCAPTFSSFDDALASVGDAVDVVLVLTPSGRHHLDARAALDAGLHTLVEKPITMRPDQADELIDRAAAKQLMFGVAFQNRFNPAVRALRGAKKAGRFGNIVTAAVRLRWCRYQEYYEDGWHGTWLHDGGVLNQQAVHHVDALDWICGPVAAVAASTANRSNRLEAEDTLVAALRFRDGSLGTIEATTALRPRDVEGSLSIVGDAGMAQVGGIALNEVQHWEFVAPEPGDTDVHTRCSEDVPTGYGLSHLPLLAEVADRLRAGRIDAPVSGSDGRRAVELVHALYASVEQGSWVELANRPRSARLGRSNEEDPA